MPRKKEIAAQTPVPSAVEAPIARTWTPEELMDVRNLGPGIIGQEKYDAAQAYIARTNGGLFGPAILSDDPAFNQAGPVKIVEGKPVFARDLAQGAG